MMMMRVLIDLGKVISSIRICVLIVGRLDYRNIFMCAVNGKTMVHDIRFAVMIESLLMHEELLLWNWCNDPAIPYGRHHDVSVWGHLPFVLLSKARTSELRVMSEQPLWVPRQPGASCGHHFMILKAGHLFLIFKHGTSYMPSRSCWCCDPTIPVNSS